MCSLIAVGVPHRAKVGVRWRVVSRRLVSVCGGLCGALHVLQAGFDLFSRLDFRLKVAGLQL